AQDLEGKPLASGGLAPNPWTFTAGATTQSRASVNLGSAASYASLAGSTVTNSGATFINGDLGLSPGTAGTGFGPGIENGAARVSPDANAASAESDLTAAFNDVAGRTTNQIVQPTGELGGLILAPCLYKAPAPGSCAISTGDLTLDAQGNSSAVWIFQMPSSTLTVGSGLQVILINGAKASNVFWEVGSSATVGGTLFRGNILASASITLQTGAMVDGRVLTQVAAVTLVTNTVTKPGPGGSAHSASVTRHTQMLKPGVCPSGMSGEPIELCSVRHVNSALHLGAHSLAARFSNPQNYSTMKTSTIWGILAFSMIC